MFVKSRIGRGSIHCRPGITSRGALFYLGFFAAVGSFVPFLNVHFRHLGLTGPQIGLLGMLSPAVMLLLTAPLSALADQRRWRVRMLVTTLIGDAIIVPLIGLQHRFLPLAFLMALQALVISPIPALADGLVARMAVRHHLNYGSIRLWGSIGFASSSVGFGALWQQLGFDSMFFLASLLFLPVILFASRLEEGPTIESERRKPVSGLARDAGLVAILVATFLAGISTNMAIGYEGIYVDHLGGSALLVGMVPAVSAYSELPGMRYSQHLARRLRGPRVLLVACLLMGSAFAGYALATRPSALLLLAVFKGLGFGLLFSSTVTLITARTPEEWSATAQALMNVSMFGLAPLITAPLGGLILDTAGPELIFILGGIAMGLAALVLLFANLRGMLG